MRDEGAQATSDRVLYRHGDVNCASEEGLLPKAPRLVTGTHLRAL